MNRVRLGMLTPSSNTALEPLCAAMLAGLPEVSVHFARFRVTQISLAQAALGQFELTPIQRRRPGDLGHDHPRVIRNEDLHHAVDYTPYEGREVNAWPAMTLLRGQVVWDGTGFTGTPGAGQFLPCERPAAARPRRRSSSWRQWLELGA